MSTMIIKAEGCVNCGETVDLAATPEGQTALTAIVVQSDDLQVTRMVVSAGQDLPPQRSVGDATVHCLEGHVEFYVDDEKHELTQGRLVYLGAKTPFSIHAVEDSVLLITMVLATDRLKKPKDVVQEASEESFPASDPPAHG